MQPDVPRFWQQAGATARLADLVHIGQELHLHRDDTAPSTGRALLGKLVLTDAQRLRIRACRVERPERPAEVEEVERAMHAAARLVNQDRARGRAFDGVMLARLDRLLRHRGRLFPRRQRPAQRVDQQRAFAGARHAANAGQYTQRQPDRLAS
jgi:hypothetical protein